MVLRFDTMLHSGVTKFLIQDIRYEMFTQATFHLACRPQVLHLCFNQSNGSGYITCRSSNLKPRPPALLKRDSNAQVECSRLGRNIVNAKGKPKSNRLPTKDVPQLDKS